MAKPREPESATSGAERAKHSPSGQLSVGPQIFFMLGTGTSVPGRGCWLARAHTAKKRKTDMSKPTQNSPDGARDFGLPQTFFRTRLRLPMLGRERQEVNSLVQQPNTRSEKRRGRARLLRLKSWPVAAKIIALCVGVAAAVAVGLTALGYTQAAYGLKQQAEAALWSDGLLVSDQVDAWNSKRLSDVQSLANLPAVSRILEAGPNADPADVQAAQDAMNVIRAAGDDVISISLLDSDGTIRISTLAPNVGKNLKQRDYFQAAMHGES